MLQSLTLAVTLAGGLAVAATEATGGPDWFAVAAVITSISGLLGTLGGLWLAARRRGNASDEALQLLREALKHQEPP